MKRRGFVGLVAAFMLSAVASQAQTLTVLHSFTRATDGAYPQSGLGLGKDGNFYGTTPAGGVNDVGMAYRISPSGTFTNLYTFNDSTGAGPMAALVLGTDGYFYGTTTRGSGVGAPNGAVFRMSSSGVVTNLFGINPNGSDGDAPWGALVQATDGNFYGTMGGDGNTNSDRVFNGTVFRMTPSGLFTNLHRFVIGRQFDGDTPVAGIIQGKDGYFYGTTPWGGTNGVGTVFKISSTGTFTTIYNFSGGTDGGLPFSKLVQGSDGYFYSTTTKPGAVFKISSAGTFTVLRTLPSVVTDTPQAALVESGDGYFYGTISDGGANGYGSLFRISSSGTFATVYDFSGPDGAYPQATLVRGSDGFFYGTTAGGGVNSCGTVFKFSAPPVPPDPISGIQSSGTDILITIPAIPTRTYQLQYRNSLKTGDWINLGSPLSNTSGSLVMTNFGGALQPQRFYRFDVMP